VGEHRPWTSSAEFAWFEITIETGLCELRFTCEGTARRVTYYIDVQRRIITLTTFRKQRQNERQEVARARQAMRASQQAEGRDG
jgi:hypothetical protein